MIHVLNYIEIAEPGCLLPTAYIPTTIVLVYCNNDIFVGLDHWEYLRVVCTVRPS